MRYSGCTMTEVGPEKFHSIFFPGLDGGYAQKSRKANKINAWLRKRKTEVAECSGPKHSAANEDRTGLEPPRAVQSPADQRRNSFERWETMRSSNGRVPDACGSYSPSLLLPDQ